MRTSRTCSKRLRRGFTLVEMLIVALILSILMAVALPLYLSAVVDSQRKTCRANLQTISNTVEAAKVANGFPDYSIIIGRNRTGLDIDSADASIGSLPDLPAISQCPSGGTYTVRNGPGRWATSFRVRCSKHGSFEPGISSN